MTASEAERRLRRAGWTRAGVEHGPQVQIWRHGQDEIRIPLTPQRRVHPAEIRRIKMAVKERAP